MLILYLSYQQFFKYSGIFPDIITSGGYFVIMKTISWFFIIRCI